MNRKDSARVERLAHALASKKRTKPEPEPPAVSRVEPPTWEKRLEERALRDRWPMTQELRLKILGRLMGIIDWRATTGEYMPPSYRDVNAAAKTILLADRLNVDQEKRAAEAIAAKNEATADPTCGEHGRTVDPARYAWYDDGCPCGVPPGECKIHPRARVSQRPPEGEWTKWFLMGGRGSGKTKAGAEWVRHLAENGLAKRIALVAPTAADVRDVMVQGESGIVSVSRPDFMPTYQPSIRRLTWPNGVLATCFSANEPDRLRGPQHDHAWIDEPAAWRYGQQTFDMLMFGLRIGENPQLVATSTPKTTKLIKGLVADPKVIVTNCTTYDNRAHLAESFFSEIISKYEGTRLGEQEILAQLLDIAEGAWFPMFSVARHVSDSAEHDTRFPIRIAIDAGSSRYTGAVLFQVRPQPNNWPKITVFADYLAIDVMSCDNAEAIRRLCVGIQPKGPDIVRLDPAASARTSLGPVAYNEYARIFGDRITARWPSHGVADGLGQIEIMLAVVPREPRLVVHPRCKHLIAAMQSYRREERGGEFLDTPVDPQHPAEDLVDALRGGVRDAFPEGRTAPSNVRSVPAARIL